MFTEKSLSITVILHDESPDVFSVVLSDGNEGLFDMTAGYEVVQAKLPDGRSGLLVVALEDKKEDRTPEQFDPFSMPEERP